MLDSRQDMRAYYCLIFSKMKSAEIITDPMEKIISSVIGLHPEYHPLLSDDKAATQIEFDANSGQSNPFLHMGMHIAIREQLASNRPAGIAKEHARLSKKLGQHDAEHQIMECLGVSLWTAQRNHSLPDENAYLQCVRKS